jgi:hypothetical protein
MSRMVPLQGRLEAICGQANVLTHPDTLATYRSDGLAHYRETPLAAVLPGTAEEVRDVVRAVARGSRGALALASPAAPCRSPRAC